MKLARNVTLAIAAAGIVVTTGVVGYAAIPGADGQVKACYATTNGRLLGIAHSKGDTRIIDSAEACRAYEKAITWSQQGPKGLPGPPGINGINGTDGMDGMDGMDGTDGTDGTDGVSGYEVVSRVETFTETVTDGRVKGITRAVVCPPDKFAISGGAQADIFTGGSVTGPGDLMASFPDTFHEISSWVVTLGKPNGGGFALNEGIGGRIYAICVFAN